MRIRFISIVAAVLVILLLTISVSMCVRSPESGDLNNTEATDAVSKEMSGDDGSGELSAQSDESGAVEHNKTRDFRAAWVATVNNLDFPSRPGMSGAEMIREIDSLVEQVYSLGLNAVVLQVHPTADALYRSDIFPWSSYLTGEQGRGPDDDFDPLAYWIERTHALNIELHAWINPYRVTHINQNITDVNNLSPDNPARVNPDWVVEHEGALYFDPGMPEVQRLLIEGVREIILRYDIDGIHLDDYFYPARGFNDEITYLHYGNGIDKDEWRRENINVLVSSLHDVITNTNPKVRFGISPSGIWQNINTSPLGSDTNGFSHYVELAADSRHWINEGWLDYICPQIYWHIGHQTADYETLLYWWGDVCHGTGVDLYIGHAAYRENPPENQYWEGEMIRQLEMNEACGVVSGDVFFRINFLNSFLGDQIREYYSTRPDMKTAGESSQTTADQEKPVIIMEELSVALPSGNITVASGVAGHNILGTSIPDLPLFINAVPVENRTAEGFFSAYVPIETGENIFEFTQPGQSTVTRKITKNQPPSSGNNDETVTTIPSSSVTPTPSTPVLYSRDEPHYATVTAELAWIYQNPTSTGGSMWHVTKGQKDRVTQVTRDGAWVKLSNGFWISKANVTREDSDELIENILGEGFFSSDELSQWVAWPCEDNPITRVNYSAINKTLTIFFGMQTETPPMTQRTPPEDSIFISYTDGVNEDGVPYVTLTLKENAVIDSYEVLYADSALQFHVRPRRLVNNSARPFEGFTFVVDPGHGGSSPGAIGPMGADLAEKEIALACSIKLAESLEMLGARVILTRTIDEELSLAQRMEISYIEKPDMFISMHANSVAETVNGTDIRGITFWYRNEISAPLSDILAQELHSINPRTTRQNVSNKGNLYVCRATWAPSVIIEIGFMCNIDDFSWMINEHNQDALTEGISNTMLLYYG